MIPSKRSEDKKDSIVPASPPPSIQKLDGKKSRNPEKSALQFSSQQQTPTNLRKKKHWRSPSNPIELAYINRHRTIYSSASSHTRHPEMLKRKIDKSELDIHIDSPCAVTKLGSNQIDFNFGVNISCNHNSSTKSSSCDSPLGRSNFALQKSLENLKIEGKRRVSVIEEMTIKKATYKHTQYKSSSLQSYETMLLKGPRPDSQKFQMMAELSISPIVSTGSSDYNTTKRHFFPFESAYCRVEAASASSGSFDSTSLAHGHISIAEDESGARVKRVSFSRCSLLQLILRNPDDNVVAGIFVVKLDLTDMPAESRTILRQKAYKSKCLQSEDDAHKKEGKFDTAPDYLSKFIEIPLKRSYDSESNRQRIQLAGPIRVAFSFNRSNLRYTSPRRSDASAVEPVQKIRTVLQFPSLHQKYFPLSSSPASHDRGRSSSLTTENTTRSFQHGSLCL